VSNVNILDSFTVKQEIVPDKIFILDSFSVKQRITSLDAPTNLIIEVGNIEWEYPTVAIDGFIIYRNGVFYAETSNKYYPVNSDGFFTVSAYKGIYTDPTDESPQSEGIQIEDNTLVSLRIKNIEIINYLKVNTLNFEDSISARSNFGFELLVPIGTFLPDWEEIDYGLITQAVTDSEDYGDLN